MIRKLSMIIAFVFAGILATGQVEDSTLIPLKRGAISKGTIEFQGHTYKCDVMEYDSPPDVVSKAIEDMMKSYGYRAEKKKGVLVYRNVHLSKVKTEGKIDAFALVKEKSKSEKDKSLVSLLFTEPGEISEKKGEGKVGAAVATIPLGAAGVAFVDDMNSDVSTKHHHSQIDDQAEAVARYEKDVRNLEKDLKDNQKKLEKLQKDIADNEKALEDARQKLAENNKKLEQMRAKKVLSKD